ncbi:MAG TPA: NifB/NifX family molybdenum-iron cluster-binding protein, partial [Dongiaceae bacterium]|nr:NifB/NifX family molybdenum-iron cluster-binding protein [Dongiaceae bacterium]
MNLCIPVEADRGLASRVSPHFGSAPAFLIVDARTDRYKAITNVNEHHAHGACNPIAALQGERI